MAHPEPLLRDQSRSIFCAHHLRHYQSTAACGNQLGKILPTAVPHVGSRLQLPQLYVLRAEYQPANHDGGRLPVHYRRADHGHSSLGFLAQRCGGQQHVVPPLSIYSDVPANPTVPGSFSQPGDMLWGERFGPGQYVATPVHWPDAEGFIDPVQGLLGMDYVLWRYDFYVDSSVAPPFVQQGSPAFPTNY